MAREETQVSWFVNFADNLKMFETLQFSLYMRSHCNRAFPQGLNDGSSVRLKGDVIFTLEASNPLEAVWEKLLKVLPVLNQWEILL